MKSDFLLAFNEIAESRNLPKQVIMDALIAALVSAYRRNTSISTSQLVEARVDAETGVPTIWVEKEVVEDIHTDQTEVLLHEARAIYPDAELGDIVLAENTPENFGRIAAQTAKQVIMQRMREAEREAQYEEYQKRVGELITGTVQSASGDVVTIGLGRTEAILPRSQQMPNEHYRMHSKVRAYVMEVKKSNRGPQIVVSRTHRNVLRRLMEYEVPEIYNGTVEIKSIAREPGARSKVAVAALQEGADPVGACVGMRGVRIQSIVKELNNEKIDVIEWSPDQKNFITKALSPARVNGVFLDDDPDSGRTAVVVVPDDQLSLAIGRAGQNARLAAKLTGWRIDIKSITEAGREALNHADEEAEQLVEILSGKEELIEEIRHIMEKKEAGRPIMPEDYDTLISFITFVEDYRISLRDGDRVERREVISSARGQVPPAAYKHPLDDTDLPLRVYNLITEAGYKTVGQVMEQFHLDPQSFLDISGFGASALESVEALVNDVEPFIEEVVEELVVIEEDIEAVQPEDEEAEATIEPIEQAEPEVVSPIVAEEEEDEEWDEEARARRAALVAGLGGGEEPVQQKPVVDDRRNDEDDFAAEDIQDEFFRDEPENKEEADRLQRERDKRRRRQLVFDEDLGRVVARRKRKRGDGDGDWDEYDDD